MYVYLRMCPIYLQRILSDLTPRFLCLCWSFCPLHPRMAAMQTTCVLVFRELGSGTSIVDSDRDIPQNSPEGGRKIYTTPLSNSNTCETLNMIGWKMGHCLFSEAACSRECVFKPKNHPKDILKLFGCPGLFLVGRPCLFFPK